MKKIIINSILISLCALYSPLAHTQTSPPEPPAEHGSSGNRDPGGGAPIGGGLGILLLLGAGYGARKILQLRKNEMEE